MFFVFTDRDRTVHKPFSSSCRMSEVDYLPVDKVNANTHKNVKCMLVVVCCLGMSRVADIKMYRDFSRVCTGRFYPDWIFEKEKEREHTLK